MDNYSKQLDEFINTLSYKPKLLLLSCCAPCSSYVLEYLLPHFEVEVLFYNPNIYPYEEYQKRLFELIKLCKIFNVKLHLGEYENEKYLSAVTGFESEKEGGKRCGICFKLRLSYAKDFAEKNGFPYFCTTLTVSPHKNAELINKIGKELETENCKYLASDFKKKNGYARSIELSKQYDLYRQDYCGCIFSINH